MDEYKVDIRFPKQGDDSIVIITGDEDNVLDAKDHLLNLAEEYVNIFLFVKFYHIVTSPMKAIISCTENNYKNYRSLIMM